MGIFLNYPSNIFSDLNNIPTTIVSADTHVLWVTALLVCNRGSAPMRFNMQKSRLTGLELEIPCYAGTTINLNATYNNGISGVGATLTNMGPLIPFSIDGINPPLESRILVKNQTLPAQNGIYTLNTIGDISTPWVLSRSLGYDIPANIMPGDIIPVINGIVNNHTKWKQTSTVTVIGTNPITFSAEPSTSIYHINELEISPYSTIDVIDITGVLQLDFNVIPYVSDSLVCFSNGYTQVFDCDVNYVQLNELS